jgi:chemotaxis protein CheZ
MMAQDFQDITGQLIKKIVAITHSAENELAQLLRDNAPAEVRAAIEAKPAELMSGPSVPAAAMVQDDVDSLLADLGF